MGRIVGAVITFVVLLGIDLFFAGAISTVEIVAGLVCATAGTALAIGLGVVAERRFAFAPPMKALLKPFVALLPETLAVGRELIAVAIGGAERQRGDFIEQPFRPGESEGDPKAAGRHALAIIGVSMAPRTFVVRGERTDALLLHCLPAKPPSPDPAWPA